MSDAHAGRGTPGRANPAEPFTLDLARGLRLCVEPRLDNISTCAFLEGEDWFKDETGFVEELARLTRPDALDVGANLGYYSLLIATASGGVSRVTAFEPNPRTAQLLRRSLQADRSGHLHVTVDERAVGERPGTAILQAGASPELDRVAPAGSPGLPVSVTSLDAATAERTREQTTGIARVAFVKLDVEGHEQQAFAGARRLIEQDDPLWMVEARDGTQLSPAAARALQPYGFRAWRALPQARCLVPLDFEHCDPALLNAFFCSPDRARSLAAAGLLTADPAGHCPPEPDRIADYLQTGTPLAGNAAAIAAFVGTLGRDAADPYASALTAWLRSCDEALSPADRGRWLLCALDRVELALSRRQSFARALAAARINAAAGQRTRAFELADLMAQAALRGQAVQIGEPFLALLPEYEANGPGADAVNWLNAMVIEAAARWRAFSSMFAQGYALNDPWPWVSARGFASVALARRHALLALREGRPIDPRARALLESDTPRHRNAAVWRVLLSDPARHLG